MLKELPEIIKQESLFDICFNNALLTNSKIALWRLPNDTTRHAALDFTEDQKVHNFSFENSKPGFVISPFYNPVPESLFFIGADFYFNTLKNIEEQEWKRYLQHIKQIHPDKLKASAILPDFTRPLFNSDQKDYFELVKKALAGIQNNLFKKVVVARNKPVNVPAGIDPVHLFNILCKEYPSAFISLIYHPLLGCWIGATPEVLVSIDQEKNFRTIALAGTQKIDQYKDLSQITWNHKEIEEQAYVNRYIANCFKTIQVRDYEENGPRTIAAGNLAHLRTDYSINITKSGIPSLGSTMLNLLHPTSAVCGLPKQAAMDFIRSAEDFDRELYSGFLGPVNINGQSHTFVNIRCAKLYSNTALLYAGAGITKDSDPAKEWQETEMKMTIIQNALTL